MKFASMLNRKVRLGAVLALMGALLGLCLFCASYVASEPGIYYWDWVGYFDRFRTYGALIAQGHLGYACRLAFDTIRHDDYNVSSLFPLFPVYLLFGGSRFVYIMSTCALYLLPASALMAAIANASDSDQARRAARPRFWLLATALLSWPLWAPTLRGLPDIIGLLPLSAATFLFLNAARLRSRPVLGGLLFGLAIWATFLLRRWYAYSCIVLIVTAVAVWALACLRDKAAARENLKALGIALSVSLATIALALAIFELPLAWRILTTSYASSYAAFQLPFPQQLDLLYQSFGLSIFLGVAAGLVRSVLEKNWRVLALLFCSAASFLFFSRTQSPGVQHLLPFYLWLFPAFARGVSWPFESAPEKYARAIWITPAIMLMGFMSVFSPAAHERLRAVAALLPSEEVFPLQIPALDSYKAMTSDLEKIEKPNSRITVFASSLYLSGSLLTSVDPALEPHMITPSDIDARDGFRFDPMKADFAVVTTAPALDYAPSTQRSVEIPDELITSGTGPGGAYKKVLGPYHIGGGLIAYVYQRTRPFTATDEAEISKDFLAYYPKWKVRSDQLSPS